MRLRFTLIAIALALLAWAGLRQESERPAGPHTASTAWSQLSSQPAPDHEPPTIVRAAVPASATAQTHVACEPRGLERPVLDASSDGRQPLREAAYRPGLPRSFPLLI